MRSRPCPAHAFEALDVLEPRMLLSGDHPSLDDFPNATNIVMVDNHQVQTSFGRGTGVLEVTGDDDLFKFTAPYTARDAIVVVQTTVGGLAPAVQIFDNTGAAISTLQDGVRGLAATQPIAFGLFFAGQTYYISARAGEPSDTFERTLTGGYDVDIIMEIPPQGQEQPPAPMPLLLDQDTGRASTSGYLSGREETDQYTLESLAAGEMQVRVQSLSANMRVHVEVRNLANAVVASGSGLNVLVGFTAPAPGQQYLVSVRSEGDAYSNPFGGYELNAQGTLPSAPPEPPQPEQPSQEQFQTAIPLPIDLRTGEAGAQDAITHDGDSDLFRFTAVVDGTATVTLEKGDASDFNGSLTVFGGTTTQVAYDPVGRPGWLAFVTFQVTAGTDYFVWVRQRGQSQGDYRVNVVAPPSEYVLFYPEGYSTGTVDEYVPLVNPNPFPVDYSITARYEIGERDQLIASGTLAPSSRGGITITSRRNPGGSLVREDTPYALEVRSSAQIGATLSHYDFGVTTGENFTSHLSNVWTFGETHRDAATFRDFVVFYNPNPSTATVRISLVYDDGEVVTFTRLLDSLRRGGVNFNNDTAVTRDGNFSVRIDSDQPIVAALSSYDIANQRGYGLLGDTSGGATEGAVPILAGIAGARPAVSLFNSGAATSNVSITIEMLGVVPGEVTRQFVVEPGTRRTLSAHDLGLDADAIAGLRYSATAPVTLVSSEYHDGDGDATLAASQAVTTSVIADAFINPDLAGTLYREMLSVYNPSATATQVVVSFLQADGLLGAMTVTVAPHNFYFMQVDQLAMIHNLHDPIAFSIRIDGQTPVVAGFMHYDLFLNGGWATIASPLGITLPLTLLGPG